ncbi:MAG TPA: PAS domain S-box protein, partial [Candidatus Tectomicrobia bacterium]|nr:PAS domain S-box protein [Candidatus Tectomicrobia bacterium]
AFAAVALVGAAAMPALRLDPAGPPGLWPFPALLLGALLVRDRAEWPSLALAITPGNLAAHLLVGQPVAAAALLTAFDVAAGVVAARAIVRWCAPPITFGTVSQVAGAVGIAAIVTPTLTATLAAAVHIVARDDVSYAPAWISVWTAAAVGAVLVAPFVATWAGDDRRPVVPGARLVEAVLLVAGETLVATLVFRLGPSSLLGPLPYLTFPFLGWAAVRFGPAGAAAASLLLMLIVVPHTAQGHGPFVDAAALAPRRALATQLYLGTAALAALVLGAVVAERERVAAALRDSEDRFRSGFDGTAVGMALQSLDGRFLRVNGALCQMLGHPEADLLARTHDAVLHEEERATDAACRARLLAGDGGAYHRETRLWHRQGRLVWGLTSVSLVRGPDGAPRYFVVQVQDVTERKRVEDAHQRLAALVQSTGEAIVGASLDGRIMSWNRGAERLFGYAAEEVVGRSLDLLVPPDRAMERARDAARVRQNEPVPPYETVRVRKDGARIEVELTISPIPGPEGAITGMSLIARDVTDRKAMERLKDEFLATVSHELRTPLTALKGHLELVLDGDAGPLTDLQEKFLRIASQNTERLTSLINDLLDVEKLAAGKIALRKEAVDFGTVLEEVAATFRLAAETRGLAFRTDIPTLPQVVGDRGRLVQVFSNLVSNAIKYTEHGEVGLRATVGYGHVEVIVWDTGIGIALEDQPHLFTRFFRTRDAAERDAGGAGLGLVIAKGLVDAHGGQIGVTSAPGVGTRIRVVLPALTEATGPAPAPGPGQPTVLVVDDEVSIRDLLLEQLRLIGCRGVAAPNGGQGLELARRLQPDVIVLDIAMPGMDGWAVLQALREEPVTRGIPVLLHSVFEDPERARQLGATDVLVKPVDLARLQEAILGALGRSVIPVLVVSPDPTLAGRIADELRDPEYGIRALDTLADAWGLRLDRPHVVVLADRMPDGECVDVLRTWCLVPAARQLAVILVGAWPPDTPALARPDGPVIEAAWGRRATDLAAQIRAVVDARAEVFRG